MQAAEDIDETIKQESHDCDAEFDLIVVDCDAVAIDCDAVVVDCDALVVDCDAVVVAVWVPELGSVAHCSKMKKSSSNMKLKFIVVD